MVKKFWNIPNMFSLLRVILSFVFIYIVFTSKLIYALLVFILAALTDLGDGFFARSKKQITKIGAVLDPIADKILIFSAVIALFIKLRLNPLVFLIFIRDIFVLLGWLMLLVFKPKKQIDFKSSKTGKLVTFLQMITVGVTIIYPTYFLFFLIITLIATFFVIIDYTKRTFTFYSHTTKSYMFMNIKDKVIISKDKFCPPHYIPHKLLFGKLITDEYCHIHKNPIRMFHHKFFCRKLKCPHYEFMIKKK